MRKLIPIVKKTNHCKFTWNYYAKHIALHCEIQRCLLNTKKLLHNSTIKHILSYASPFQTPISYNDIKILPKAQYKLAREMVNATHYIRNRQMRRDLQMETIQAARFSRGFYSKILPGTRSYPSGHAPVRDSVTRCEDQTIRWTYALGWCILCCKFPDVKTNLFVSGHFILFYSKKFFYYCFTKKVNLVFFFPKGPVN